MYFVYILYSTKSDKYYIGYTDDPERRLIEHNTSPRNTFTSKHRPWVSIIHFPISENRSDAIRVELFIKKQKSKNFILKLLDQSYRSNLLAQLVRVP